MKTIILIIIAALIAWTIKYALDSRTADKYNEFSHQCLSNGGFVILKDYQPMFAVGVNHHYMCFIK